MAVTVADVGVAARRPITGEADVAAVEQWISWVGVLIAQRFRDPARQPSPEIVDMVTTAVVAAMVQQRTDGSRITQVQIDDGLVSRQYQANRDLLDLLGDWWDWLEKSLPDGGSSHGAWSIRLGGAR